MTSGPTPSSKEGTIAVGKQSAKGTAATAVSQFLLTSLSAPPQVIRVDPQPEIGSGSLSRGQARRIGHEGANLSLSGLWRSGHLAHVLHNYGLTPYIGGFVFYTGVNDTISVTDDGGGPATVNILTGGGLTSGVFYSGAEVAAALKTALDADATLSQTYTVAFSTSTLKFTISHGGSTLSLHWTTTPMMANQLGFDHAADDTGETSYASDEARDVMGRHSSRDGDNEGIVVTDDGGGPATVDVLSGTGAVLVKRIPYSPWGVCAGLKAVLDNDATLTQVYTVTYSATTNKYTVANAGSTLTIPWTNASCTIATDLGFSTDDSGATTYTGDLAIVRAPKAIFAPNDVGTTYPWYTYLDKMDNTGMLDLIFYDARLHALNFEAGSNAELTFTAEGKALKWKEATGSEVVTAEAGLDVPNTADAAGHVKMAGADYRIMESTWALAWEPRIEPQQVHGEAYSVTPGENSVTATFLVGLGADNGDVYRKTFFGSASGTEYSNTVVEEAVDVMYVGGQDVTGQTNSTERYAWRFEADEAQLEDYPINQEGNTLLQGNLALNIQPGE